MKAVVMFILMALIAGAFFGIPASVMWVYSWFDDDVTYSTVFLAIASVIFFESLFFGKIKRIIVEAYDEAFAEAMEERKKENGEKDE